MSNRELPRLLIGEKGGESMYGLIFTSILVFILIYKTYKLRKNKRSNGSFEDMDEELEIMLTEGDTFG